MYIPDHELEFYEPEVIFPRSPKGGGGHSSGGHSGSRGGGSSSSNSGSRGSGRGHGSSGTAGAIGAGAAAGVITSGYINGHYYPYIHHGIGYTSKDQYNWLKWGRWVLLSFWIVVILLALLFFGMMKYRNRQHARQMRYIEARKNARVIQNSTTLPSNPKHLADTEAKDQPK